MECKIELKKEGNIRRPLELVGILTITGIICGYFLNEYLMICIILVSTVFVALVIFQKKLFIIFLLLSLIFTTYTLSFQNNLDNLLEDEINLTGRILSAKVKKGNFNQYKYDFIIKTKEGYKIKCAYYDKRENTETLVGRVAKLKGTLTKPEGARNPHTFSNKLNLGSKGIFYEFKTSKFQIKETRKNSIFEKLIWNPINKICKIRDDHIKTIKKAYGEKEAGLLIAMIFGDKSDLDDELYSQFQKNGTAHLLATSGLHVGIIYAAISSFIKIKRRILPNILIGIFLLIYLVMADFNYSIMRAIIMIILSIIGKIIHRRYDLITAGWVSALFIMTLNPLVLFNLGFQMSFLAIFVLASGMEIIKQVNFKYKFIEKILPVLIIQVVMSPFIIFTFNYFSLSAFFANIPVTFLAGIIMPLSFLNMALNVSGIIPPAILEKIMSKAITALTKTNELTYLEGKLTFDVISPSLFIIGIFYIIYFMLTNDEMRVLISRRSYKKIASFFAITIIVLTFLCKIYQSPFDTAKAIFIDVGQGNAMIFKGKNGKTLLIDGGGSPNYDVGEKILKPMLLKNGISKIDLAIISHLHKDHYLGITTLAKSGFIGKLATYSGNGIVANNLKKEFNLEKDDLLYLKSGDKLNIDEDLNIYVLWPNKKTREEYKREIKSADENDRSLVVKVNLQNKSFITTGDIGIDTEMAMLEYLKSKKISIKGDIVQVPHHGSKGSSSDELIEAVKGKVAIFQVGKNNYGHPANSVIEKYEKNCIIVGRNDKDGAVGFTFEDGQIKFIKMLN